MMRGPTIDRRGFAALLAGATGAVLLGPARALTSDPVAPPPVPVAPLPVISPTSQAGPPMLARAKAALDAHSRAIALRDRIGIADFASHSRELRFRIVDLIKGQDWSYLVAHGRGSDPEHTGYLQRFSNEEGSLASSSGAFLTDEIYEGEHGQAMRLKGLDASNSNAEDRAIVMHGAPYVSEDHIARWGKCGRSEGCLVFAPHRLSEVLALLGPGRMIYADKV